jgi:hypothetical protein
MPSPMTGEGGRRRLDGRRLCLQRTDGVGAAIGSGLYIGIIIASGAHLASR